MSNTPHQPLNGSAVQRQLRTVALRHGGFTLMEVMIAVLVLVIGLLGLAGMQAAGMKNNANANLRTQASFLAYDIIDRMRANATLALAGNYNIAVAVPAPTTPTTLAQQDLVQWKGSLAVALPLGDGAVAVVNATGVATVTVQWTERDIASNAGRTVTFQYSTRL